MAIALHVYRETWFETGALGLLGGLIYVRHRYQSNGLILGIGLALTASFVLSWLSLWNDPAMALALKMAHLVPLLALAYLAMRFSYVEAQPGFIRWPGVYLLGLQIGISVYFVFNPVSPLIPGVVWLMLSVGTLELASLISKRVSEQSLQNGESYRYVLHLGYAYILAFVVRHFLVDLQAEVYLGPVHARLLIEGFAIAVSLYWWLYRPTPAIERCKNWLYLHPLFLELSLLFFVVIVLTEVSQLWHPLYWAVTAVALLMIKDWGSTASRLRFYSLLFSWAASLHLAAVTSVYVTPTVRWYEEAWVSGSITVSLLFVYLWQSHRRLILSQIEFPASLAFCSLWVGKIDQRKPLWIYYPFFFCIAIYLYAGFDKSILTLLWVIEAFGVFVLSIVLKEQHFRYISLTALAVCLMRLLLYDLAQSDTLTRAIVFLGVGLIMLLMHSVYNKFKGRFT